MKQFNFVLAILGCLLPGHGCAFNLVSSSFQLPNKLVRWIEHDFHPAVTGAVSGVLICSAPTFGETEIEYSELPPPYIPVVFGLVLLLGVGVLTGSLGDVIDEESQLGLQSGTKARKEIERSRSSYFKKK